MSTVMWMRRPPPSWNLHQQQWNGPIIDQLWSHCYDWQCRDGSLQVEVLASQPQELAEAEVSEPRAGAWARLQQQHPFPEALLCLRGAADSFAGERRGFAHGVRLLDISRAEDERWWDEALVAVCSVMVCRTTYGSVRPDGG